MAYPGCRESERRAQLFVLLQETFCYATRTEDEKNGWEHNWREKEKNRAEDAKQNVAQNFREN